MGPSADVLHRSLTLGLESSMGLRAPRCWGDASRTLISISVRVFGLTVQGV